MQLRKLGRSGIEVSAMGLGCWAIGGPNWRDGNPIGYSGAEDKESIRAIRTAIDKGVNFIDTADVYGCGHSERVIGKAIKGMRDQLVIASKFGYPINEKTRITAGMRCDPDYIRFACDESLRRLNTDYIDLYQFHLKDSDQGPQVREILEALVQTGKIRYYGWSTDNPDRARVFAEGEHCIAIQQRLNIFEGSNEVLQICEENNLASINRSPLGMGMLSGKFTTQTIFPEDDLRKDWNMQGEDRIGQMQKVEAIRDILTSGRRTLVQGALCWIWARSPVTIPIPGFKNVFQIAENIGALEFPSFSNSQMQEISRIIEFKDLNEL